MAVFSVCSVCTGAVCERLWRKYVGHQGQKLFFLDFDPSGTGNHKRSGNNF